MWLSKTRRPFRFAAFITYWAWLTGELLVSDPWVLLSANLAKNPPIDTHNKWMSFAIHLGAFSVLGFLLTWATEKLRHSTLVAWFSGLFAYAGLTEILQMWVPKRWPSTGDAFFNIVGIGVGLWAFHKVTAWSQKRTSVPLPKRVEPVPAPVQKAA